MAEAQASTTAGRIVVGGWAPSPNAPGRVLIVGSNGVIAEDEVKKLEAVGWTVVKLTGDVHSDIRFS